MAIREVVIAQALSSPNRYYYKWASLKILLSFNSVDNLLGNCESNTVSRLAKQTEKRLVLFNPFPASMDFCGSFFVGFVVFLFGWLFVLKKAFRIKEDDHDH